MRSPKWYSLYDGPRNLEELAHKVGCPGLYSVFYRTWSGATHGTDILVGKLRGGDEKTHVLALRNPGDAQFVTSLAMTLTLHFFRLHIETLVPNHTQDLQEWYLGEIRGFHKVVASAERIIGIE